jgi:hypothetical protein
MTLTHEYGLMLICWSTWLVLLKVIDIYYDVLLEAYGIVGYHAACIFHMDGLHIETCRLIVILYIIGES